MKTNVFHASVLSGIILVMLMLPTSSAHKERRTELHHSGSMKPICIAWAIISLDEYEISNNIWGKGNINEYSQCVFGKLNPWSRRPEKMGWSWNWPKGTIGVKAFPSILYGYKPWNNYSTTTELPQAINQLKYLTVSYQLESVRNGSVNLLLESWITSTSKPNPSSRVGELAIHLFQDNVPGQAGKFIESVVINGITFDFYIERNMRVPGDKDTWVYYGFVHKGTSILQAKLDMMKFVNYLVSHGYVDRKHYIASIELGNEVDHGKGITKLEHFSVKVGH